ncbi:uncharacterized protein LOC106711307 isoform X1 [Papilio machaon]|uniref:uncharacterized protein LOC106711307 isoform X1 n=1 Tax=Papilio machaon TaxID=76193 RepID=UPI0006EB0EB4|nr:uncharacterized protein LOC106711307 isoform X1 [Papilio machaon]
MPETETHSDAVELCALLQCLGYSVKTLSTTDGNASEDGPARTVVINCPTSGLHVVLESNNLSCSCPASTQQQNSGIWQVSGMTGGKQLETEYGSSLLGTLPKQYRERLTKELFDMMRGIKENSESDLEKPKRDSMENKSMSMLEMKTPDKRKFQLALETPTRYRSLDTLTAKDTNDQNLPAPGPLQKHVSTDMSCNDVHDTMDKKKFTYQRQSTYTLSSTPDSVTRRNKTSSPIQGHQNKLLEKIISAERHAESLRNKLADIVKDIQEDGKCDTSMSSLALDVSKISLLKGESSKVQFASSPNLSGLRRASYDFPKSKKLYAERASTSDLLSNKRLSKEGKIAKFRRVSPKFLKLKKDTTDSKAENGASHPKNNKLNMIFKQKIATPVRIPKVNEPATSKSSPNLSATKKKYSHIKSTIPRPSSFKRE